MSDIPSGINNETEGKIWVDINTGQPTNDLDQTGIHVNSEQIGHKRYNPASRIKPRETQMKYDPYIETDPLLLSNINGVAPSKTEPQETPQKRSLIEIIMRRNKNPKI